MADLSTVTWRASRGIAEVNRQINHQLNHQIDRQIDHQLNHQIWSPCGPVC
jgi:ribosomal protein L31E